LPQKLISIRERMRAPLCPRQPGTCGLGSNQMMQRCVEKIMQRTNVSEVDARHVLQHVVKQAWNNDLTKAPLAERSPPSPRSCRVSQVWSSPPLPPQPQPQQQLHAFPRLTRSLSPHALANFQHMLSQQPAQTAMPSPYPALSGPLRSAQYDSPPESPRSPMGDDVVEQQVDLSRSTFDSFDGQCAQQTVHGVLPTPSQDRAMAAPMFLRGGGLACGAMEGTPLAGRRPVAVPYGLSSGSWHETQTPSGVSPRGLMAVTLQPGMSSIVDLRSHCTDGLLLLSTTASFVPRARAQPHGLPECGFAV
jgi:hypothetical protein